LEGSPRTGVAQADRQLVLSRLHESARLTVARLHVSESDFYSGLARSYLDDIDRELDEGSRGGEPATERLEILRRARDRISSDPRHAVEYRQDLLEAAYGGHVDRLETWLSRSPQALAMLNDLHIRRRFPDIPSAASGPTLVGEAARSLLFVAPLTAAYDAQTLISGTHRVLAIAAGIYDVIWGASRVVVGYSLAFTQRGRLTTRDLRKHRKAFESAREELNSVLGLALGERVQVNGIPELGPRQTAAAEQIRIGALSFIIFHELAHLLLPHKSRRQEEELKCDAFATSVCCASKDPLVLCGTVMGLVLMSALLRRTNTHVATANYPSIDERLYRAWTILEAEGGVFSSDIDQILSAPTRLMEEEIFRTESTRRIFPNLAIALTDA